MNNLRELRKQAKITLKEFGTIFGLAESTISQYENGKRQPDLETIKKIADYFNVSIDYLLGKEYKDIPVSKIDPQILKLLENPSEDLKKLIERFNELTPENQQLLLDVADLHFDYQDKKKNAPIKK